MPLKCCVPKCHSNYDNEKTYIPVYKLPTDEEERKTWVRMIPRANLKITQYTAVCKQHWPSDIKFKASRNGKLRPADPPTIFKNIPDSCLSTPPAKFRKTTERTTSDARNVEHDELVEFKRLDVLTFESIPDHFNEDQNITVFTVSDGVRIQSTDLKSGVPKFVINLKKDFTFECCCYGISCNILTLSHNNISLCKKWSSLDEIVRFLKTKEFLPWVPNKLENQFTRRKQ